MGPRHAFSLLEALAAIVLLGVLTAVALPSWTSASQRAQRAELPTTLDGLLAAELAYYAAEGRYALQPTFTPDALPGRNPRPWVGEGFDRMGYRPEGTGVVGSYAAMASPSYGIELHGISDVDGDGRWSWWRARPGEAATMMSAEDAW